MGFFNRRFVGKTIILKENLIYNRKLIKGIHRTLIEVASHSDIKVHDLMRTFGVMIEEADREWNKTTDQATDVWGGAGPDCPTGRLVAAPSNARSTNNEVFR